MTSFLSKAWWLVLLPSLNRKTPDEWNPSPTSTRVIFKERGFTLSRYLCIQMKSRENYPYSFHPLALILLRDSHSRKTETTKDLANALAKLDSPIQICLWQYCSWDVSRIRIEGWWNQSRSYISVVRSCPKVSKHSSVQGSTKVKVCMEIGKCRQRTGKVRRVGSVPMQKYLPLFPHCQVLCKDFCHSAKSIEDTGLREYNETNATMNFGIVWRMQHESKLLVASRYLT